MINNQIEELRYLGPNLDLPRETIFTDILQESYDRRGTIGGHLAGAALLAMAAGGLTAGPAQAKEILPTSDGTDPEAFFLALLKRETVIAGIGAVIGGLYGWVRQGNRGVVFVKADKFDWRVSSVAQCSKK